MDKKIQAVLDLFEELNKVPRQSKHEEKISAWLVEWAEKNGLKAERDESMNVLIKAPATPGYEDKPTVVIEILLPLYLFTKASEDLTSSTKSL